MSASILRRMILGAGATLVFVGCLFPSFDELKGSGSTETPAGDDDDDDTSSGKKDSGKTSSTSSGGSTTSGDPGTSTSSSSGTPVDSGADTAPPQKHTVDCDGKICDLATQVCCDEAGGGAVCKSKSAGCDIWTFSCDDFTDCPDGQRCCKGGGLEVSCAPSCGNGLEICSSSKSSCRSGACGSDLIGPPNVNVRVCQ